MNPNHKKIFKSPQWLAIYISLGLIVVVVYACSDASEFLLPLIILGLLICGFILLLVISLVRILVVAKRPDCQRSEPKMSEHKTQKADITFECPECKQHLVIDAGDGGSEILCPTCSKPITVPQSSIQTTFRIHTQAGMSPVPKKPIYRLKTSFFKLAALAAFVVLMVFIISAALDSYHRSQSTILFNSGSDKYAKGDYDGALNDFNKVIKYRPDFADAYNGRGMAKYSKSDYGGALSDFNEVIQLRPDFPEAYCNRGCAEFCKSDMDAALADCNRAIQDNPGDAVAYAIRGNIANAKGDYDGALGDYDKAIQIKPDYTYAISIRDKLKAAHEDAKPEPSLASIIALFQNKLSGYLAVKDEQGFTHNASAAQFLFDCIHPIGTAKGILVTDAVLNKDDNGKIQSVGLKLLLYWQGPMKSGSTTFQMLYDNSNDTFETDKLNVLRTDGITREDVNNFVGGAVIGAQIGQEIHNALNGN